LDNYGLVERSDHEEWGKMGPLAEATPVNAKNRGAANRRRRKRDEGRDTRRNEEGSRAREGQEDREEQGSGEENKASETEELRRVMAEAIGEMEREEEETKRVTCKEERGGNEGQKWTQTKTTGLGTPADNEDREEGVTRATTEERAVRHQLSQGCRETRGSQHIRSAEGESTEQPQLVIANTNANEGESNGRVEVMQYDLRTPLKRLRDAL
jgi:hypothetical protein